MTQMAGEGAGDALLRTDNLAQHLSRLGAATRSSAAEQNVARTVDGVNGRGPRRREALGIIGESGCGKSTLGRCLVRLTTSPPDKEWSSRVGDITRLSQRQL